jgi:hypothetical protein
MVDQLRRFGKKREAHSFRERFPRIVQFLGGHDFGTPIFPAAYRRPLDLGEFAVTAKLEDALIVSCIPARSITKGLL